MSTPLALTAEDLLREIHAHLVPFVETAQKGYLSVARDPLEITELLGEAPGRFRCILNWAGEKPTGHKDSGIVTHEFTVIVSHNRGLSIVRGQNLFMNRADEPPLTQLCGNVRDLLRTLRFPKNVTSVTLEYLGTDPIALDGTQIDAFSQRWSLIAALPKVAL